MKKPSIDVWSGDGMIAECLPSVAAGKRVMQQLHKIGNEGVRMYADFPNGKRWYFYFKNDKIIRESNNLDN